MTTHIAEDKDSYGISHFICMESRCPALDSPLTQVSLADRGGRDSHDARSLAAGQRLSSVDILEAKEALTHPFSLSQIASMYLTKPGRPSCPKASLTKLTPWCVVATGG
jgi:hypothetical protein